MLRSFTLAAGIVCVFQTANADPVYIQNLTFGGTGCGPSDSSGAIYDVNNDGLPEQFVVFFSKYVAEQGPGIPLSRRYRNCNIAVQMFLPQGFQYSIANVTYEGHAEIPRGVTGRQVSTYLFPFHSNSVTLQSMLPGSFSGDYSRLDQLGIASVVWSPCGMSAPLNIRTSVRLEGPNTPRAYMTTDEIDGYVKQIYGLQWRRCN